MDKTEIQHIVQEFMTMLDTNRPAAELVAFFHRSLRAYGAQERTAERERIERIMEDYHDCDYVVSLATFVAKYGTDDYVAAIRAQTPPPTQE